MLRFFSLGICLLVVLVIQPLLQCAPRPIEKPVLTVAIALPINHGKRSIFLGGPAKTQFHVVVTNCSDKPVKLWREWCSWGYGNLSFEVEQPEGKPLIIKKKPGEWGKNYPDVQTLQPGDLYVIQVTLDSNTWEILFPKGEADKPRDFKMRAVFEIKPDHDSGKLEVWTGRLMPKFDTYAFWGNP